MSIGGYAVGVLLALVSLLPIAAGARQVRARVLPSWSGSAARVGEAVIAVTLVILALEVVGVMGVLTQVGAAVACVTTGAIAWVGAGSVPGRRRRGHTTVAERAPHPGTSRVAVAVAVIGVSVAGAPWLGWVAFAYRQGMQTVDTLWYHMPFAARFVQSASILHLHYVDRDPATPFFPANSELLHALGLLWFRSDLLSPVINLAWAALALAAAWSIGSAARRGPHCLLGAVLVLGTPGLVDTQPGEAYNDIVCLALLLACAAVLVRGGARPAPTSIAAAAAGLALGTKYTMIVPAIVLGVGVVAISAQGTRMRQAGLWAIGLVLAGGYWYVRNAVIAGNPLVPLSVHLGPLSLPAPLLSTPQFTVFQYLTDLHVWRAYYLPGLRQSLGLAWWALVALGAVGALSSLLARGQAVRRVLGGVAVVSAVAFVMTPQFLGSPGAPIFFAANVRYALGAIVLGIVLLPLNPVFGRERVGALWLGLTIAVLAATELDPGVWPTGIRVRPLFLPVHGQSAVIGVAAASTLGLGALLLLWRGGSGEPRRGRLPVATVVACATALAVIVGGLSIAESYSRGRYASALRIPTISAWARGIRNARIGIVGLGEQYTLYGPDDSNYVQYIGRSRPHAGFGAITNCPDWRRAVDRGHYQWLVLGPSGFPTSSHKMGPEVGWTTSTPAATILIRDRPISAVSGKSVVLVGIHGLLDPSSCPPSPTAIATRQGETRGLLSGA